MNWKIVADSACDLRTVSNLPQGLSYAFVPLKIRVGDREYVDNSALDARAMMDAVHNFNGPTSTACPSPEEWAEQFRSADCSLAITITGALSGSYGSALIAREMVLEEFPNKKIFVIDSLSTGSEMVLLVNTLVQLVRDGCSFDELCQQGQMYADKYQLLFMLSDFDNLIKNGRINRIVGFVAGAMNMCAVGCASRKGTLEILHKTRGQTRGLAFLLEEMDRRGYNGGPVVICHCFNEKSAQLLEHGIHAKWPEAEVKVYPTRGLCSYYAEEAGILVGF